MREYSVYKGLQKPLVFRGFKGRYIYWGVGFIILSIVLAGLLGALINLVAGVFTMILVMVGGIFYTSTRQKQGLYDKTKSKGIYVLQANLKGVRNVKKERI